MIRLLVVDDEIEICEFLKSYFEERGYQVETAGSGDRAIHVLEKFDPHLVLLDVQMPGMNGLDTLKWIKTYHPAIKVIMVTALETQEKIETALRYGADNYITKPLNLNYLDKEVQGKIVNLIKH